MKEWLAQSVEGRAYPFVVATYVEKVGWASAGASCEMARLLGKSTASPEFIERVSSRRGWGEDRARATYVAEMQPDNDAVKKGKFGEVLHGACEVRAPPAYRPLAAVGCRLRDRGWPHTMVCGPITPSATAKSACTWGI